ncbi:alpha/beta-hydrolase [Cristinia sonorae]|uniref:GPI inositol-deacylase n=1 Tax=Cristinia sonorae TaxID=1940300 RepID=A0A8K0ULI1_9AGAR|nr:alpha/beta-hydrolase [Cristinia sonorae]
MQAQGDQKSTLSARLTSLFSSSESLNPKDHPPNTSSEPASRRRSLDESFSWDSTTKAARTRPPSPSRIPSMASSSFRPSHSAKAFSIAIPSGSSVGPGTGTSKARKPPHPSLPVLRWLTGQSAFATTPERPTTSTSAAATPTPSNPPSPSAYSALDDALHDNPSFFPNGKSRALDLPSRPEAARLPPAFHSARPPNYLSSLARSALPTACISPLSPTSAYRTTYADPFDDPFASSSSLENHNDDLDLLYSPTPIPLAMPPSPPAVHLSRSPPKLTTSPKRSSVDTLRSIQEKGKSIHTSAPQPAPLFPNLSGPWKGWFNSEPTTDKEMMDPFLDEQDKAPTAQAQREKIQRKYFSPQNPVVFCHGLLGFDTVKVGLSIAPVSVTHWRGIKDALEANGVEVLITRVPATSSPIDRAKVLEKRISEVYPGRSVHLIGHSMGGIDCRYLTTHLTNRTFDVLSITTISSPHRGSSFADTFLETVGKDRMPSVLSLLDLLPNGGGDGQAFEALTVENMRKFNEQTPDVPGVKYFSWGAVYDPGMIDTWKWSHSVVLEKEGPNDGLVSLKSAQWGTYLGTLEGVNHLDLVGWVNTARYKWAEIMGREIKFKPATFYLGIADHLARVVEGQETASDDSSSIATTANMSEEERSEMEEIREEGERVEMAESLGKGEESKSEECTPSPGPISGANRESEANGR